MARAIKGVWGWLKSLMDSSVNNRMASSGEDTQDW